MIHELFNASHPMFDALFTSVKLDAPLHWLSHKGAYWNFPRAAYRSALSRVSDFNAPTVARGGWTPDNPLEYEQIDGYDGVTVHF